MPWLAFSRDFDFRPTRRVALAYKAGQTALVTTPAADAAEAAGAGKRVPSPKAMTDGSVVLPATQDVQAGPDHSISLPQVDDAGA